jgi:hypothetical protein
MPHGQAAEEEFIWQVLGTMNTVSGRGEFSACELDRLVAAALPLGSPPGIRSSMESSDPPTEWAQIALLAPQGDTPAGVLERLYAMRYAGQPFDEWIELLIQHRNAPITLLRRIARDRVTESITALPNDHYRDFLFERAQERNDAELRRILADTMPELSLDHLAQQPDQINVEWPIII